MPDHPSPPPLEFVFEARIEIADPIVVGPTPRGERRMIPILRGEFDGPTLRGRILPGGADCKCCVPTASPNCTPSIYSKATPAREFK
jgi:hypothetical protein